MDNRGSNEEAASFLSSCLENDLQVVRSSLRDGVDIDIQDAEGTTGLQIAATNGYKMLAEYLIAQGADVNLANNCGWTPLMHAAQHGQVSVVSLLLHHCATVNATSYFGVDALTLAAGGGHHSTVCLLLEVAADVADSAAHRGSGLTPLGAAAVNGHISVINALLQRGSSVNQVLLATGATPLMLAASGGHLRAAQVLMDHHANPDQNSFYGQTALDVATACVKTEVAEYLRSTAQMVHQEHNPDVTDIFDAIEACDLNEVKRILEERPQCCNWFHSKKGTTPLMQAAILGYIDAVALLVEGNADLELQDCSAGWTALMHAAFHGQTHIVRYLISSGADVYLEAFNGATALDIACYREDGNTKIIQILADETVAGLPSRVQAETERNTGDQQHLRALKDLIGGITQKLTTWRSGQSLLTSIGWAASFPSTVALDLQSLNPSITHEPSSTLDISFTSPETVFPEVDTVYRAVPPSLMNYKKILEGVQAASTDSSTRTHSQKVTRKATEPKFYHSKQSSLTESDSSGLIISILQALGLGKYAENFKENEVDWEAFVNLDPGSIEAIGVQTGISREVLQEAIYELQKMQ